MADERNIPTTEVQVNSHGTARVRTPDGRTFRLRSGKDTVLFVLEDTTAEVGQMYQNHGKGDTELQFHVREK